MSNGTAHTPTPWEACEKGDYSDFGGESVVILGDECTRRIAAVHCSDGEGAANAAFIVRACNSHEALVEALSEAAIWMRFECGRVHPYAPHVGDTPLKAIEAALALAKGEQA